MDATKPIYPLLPTWVACIYGLLALILVPWVTYLALTLPTRHLARHWDVSWVGLDVAIGLLLILNSVFSYFESKWLVISATATATLLYTDAWFDVMSARSGLPFVEALSLALFIELPLATMTLWVGLRVVHHEHARLQLAREATDATLRHTPERNPS